MENNERVLRLSDLLSILLRKLIPILCITLAFTLLGFAYAFLKSHRGDSETIEQPQPDALNAAETRYAITAQTYETANKEMEYFEEEQLSSLWDRVRLTSQRKTDLIEYLNSSPVLSLDPNNCPVSDISLLIYNNRISPAGLDFNFLYNAGSQAASVISSICTLDTSVLEQTGKILGIDDDVFYVQQLISVFNDNGVVHIRVYFSDLDTASKAVDYLYKTVSERLSSNNADFTYEEIGRFSGYIVDSNLKGRQSSYLTDLSQAITQLTDAENSLSGLSAQMEKMRNASAELTEKYNSAEQELSNLQDLQNQSAAAERSGRLSVRTIALALILGLFVGCFAVICIELLNGKLNSQFELNGRYSFPLLGLLPSGKKRLFDKTIRRLEGESSFDFDTVARATAQSLVSVSDKHSVCFVSSLGSKTASTLLPYLDGRISVCGDILNDPEAVKALEKYDSIVLVEQRRLSELNLIDSEVLRAKALGKEILGIVLI